MQFEWLLMWLINNNSQIRSTTGTLWVPLITHGMRVRVMQVLRVLRTANACTVRVAYIQNAVKCAIEGFFAPS